MNGLWYRIWCDCKELPQPYGLTRLARVAKQIKIILKKTKSKTKNYGFIFIKLAVRKIICQKLSMTEANSPTTCSAPLKNSGALQKLSSKLLII
ncbi:hypothetical protein BpHYR1_000938 [Brachionus plicatilis]|uniref:Uncharacterized protein n=1 Tax=Brachionus plicatilis TaxID=10195 RepID=A0A3M7RBI9_BRAPC|nr:hypothetical protein BpHYR1_000938 [Brachionus plicatilis]